MPGFCIRQRIYNAKSLLISQEKMPFDATVFGEDVQLLSEHIYVLTLGTVKK